MKMRLVKKIVPPNGLTVGTVYEGNLDGEWFMFNDDEGDARRRLSDEFEPVPEPGNRYNASDEGKPEPGQWWLQTDKQNRTDAKFFRVFFCGKDSKNRLIFEDADGHTEVDHGCDWSGWRHEPACTGWDWVPEMKKWPQWLIPTKTELSEREKKPIAFYRRDGEHSGETFHTDGSSFKWGSWEHLTDVRVCSQREAWDQILPKKPVESPDDWVTQDRVIARKGVDEYRWIWRSGNPSTWQTYDWNDVTNHVHGYTDDLGERLEVRCRRKDLPVVEEKNPLPCSYCSKPEFKGWYNGKCPYCGTVKETVTVTLYEVLYGDEVGENGDELTLSFCTSEKDLNRIREVWKYVSVVSTKTVEVML